MEELERENSLLKSEKEEMNRRILQQPKGPEGESRTSCFSGLRVLAL